MALTLIKKRSGSIVDFDQFRIENAVKKAYDATSIAITDEAATEIANTVVQKIELAFGEGEDARIPSVEDIQNEVERAIAERGDFLVAKAYILYRQERAEVRYEQQQALLEKIDRAEIKVKKRSGKIVPFDIKEVERAIENVCQGFEKCVNIPEIVAAVKLNVYDGITSSEINKAIVMTLKTSIEKDPSFALLTARFLINDLYKDILGADEFAKHFSMLHEKGFITAIRKGVEAGILDPRMGELDLKALAKELDFSRDKVFNYMGVQVLYDRYFLRTHDQRFLETPQYFWMRIAMGLSLLEKDPTAKAKEFYHSMSSLRYIPSTPTLLHSGLVHSQMSSCYLTTITDDLHHIFKCVSDNAQLSKWSGGLGNDVTDIRATNALVKAINTGSQGVIPFIKVIDATSNAINRSGKRRGATCVYLETWHMDIEDFLDLRKNTGDERRRTHDTNTANWIPDLFMKRVQEGGDWTLFSPEEVPELHHIYGRAFEEKYVEYEKKADKGDIALWKRVKAQDLWRKMIMMLFETGHPWITWKDPSNIRSPQDHVGVVHSSNLCTEIILNTSKDETAVCNLGSVNLPMHIENGVLNKEKMAETIKLGMRMLDNVIDLNFYPTIEGKTSNLRHRPVGMDIIGFQDMLYMINVNFDSEKALDVSDELMEFVSYYAILASTELAEERGAYSTFKGSKWERQIFPIDTLALLEKERGLPVDVNRNITMDWSVVREAVKQHGMRNSNCMAIAPTATRANISGCLPSIEPIYKNMYVKSNFSGEFTVLNSFLVEDLKTLNLWNTSTLEKIKQLDGNISEIDEIPNWVKAKYKEVFQIDPYWVIAHAARRGKWIDQSQSINIFMNTQSGKAISDVYMQAWNMGLKTTYYLRTLGASAIEKSTIDINKFKDQKPNADAASIAQTIVVKPKLTVFKDESCESCT